MSSLSDRVAKMCFEHFKELPKKGKPQSYKEWTLLAAIVMSFNDDNTNLKIVAMCTGTKCLGESQLCQGDALSDSHAEVLVRRAFIRFLYYHMHLVLQQKNSDVLLLDDKLKTFSVKPDIKFFFFVSHIPCGDAAIFPKDSNDGEVTMDSDIEPKRKKFKDDTEKNATLLQNVNSSDQINDIYRTGAKCVKEGLQDPKAPGEDYHVVGALRTKPGRGIPTLSMSCSDKIALWNVCGLQGALLSHFLSSPIYTTSFIFGKCPYNRKAVERAIFERLSNISGLPPSYCMTKPTILQSSLAFEYSKENILKMNEKAIPCPSSIIWSDVPDPLIVSVNGKKQGVTKKNFDKPSSRVCVCRKVFFKSFFNIAQEMSHHCEKYKSLTEENLTYLQCKLSAEAYQTAKKAAFKIFQGWVHKPDSLQHFHCLK